VLYSFIHSLLTTVSLILRSLHNLYNTGLDHFAIFKFNSLIKATITNMLNSILPVLLASAGLIEARSVFQERHVHFHRRAGGDATGTTLSPAAIQSGSFNDGSDEIGSNEAQQAKSLTSQNNFINNCAGKTLTNGLQITTGSCNGIRKFIGLKT
jgi:hypothetical protein